LGEDKGEQNFEILQVPKGYDINKFEEMETEYESNIMVKVVGDEYEEIDCFCHLVCHKLQNNPEFKTWAKKMLNISKILNGSSYNGGYTQFSIKELLEICIKRKGKYNYIKFLTPPGSNEVITKLKLKLNLEKKSGGKKLNYLQKLIQKYNKMY